MIDRTEIPMPEQEINPENRIDISDSSDELEQFANIPDDVPEENEPPLSETVAPESVSSEASEILELDSPESTHPESEEIREIELEVPADLVPYIEQMQARLDEAIAARQRSQADFSNYQRRAMENERQAFVSGMVKVIQALLPMLDHFDLALHQDLEAMTVEKLLNGVQLVRDGFNKSLQSLGVEIIEPTVGEEFDPNRHEAMLRQSAEGIEPNQIVMVMQPGYVMGEMVLRPAKVAVAPVEDE